MFISDFIYLSQIPHLVRAASRNGVDVHVHYLSVLLLEYLAPDQVVKRQEDPRTFDSRVRRSESLLVIECGETSESADGQW